VARRGSLPGSRAVVGGLLIALAALGTFVAAGGNGGGPTHRFVVAARDVTAGTTLGPADVTVLAIDLPDGVAARAFSDPSRVAGRVTTAAIAKGELVQASAVVTGNAADPRFQLSLPVERARALDGLVAPGEKVDVLVTYGTGSDSVTFVVVRRAEVLRVDTGKSGSISASSDVILLLAVASPDDALAVTHASQDGKVTIVRATAAATDDGPDSYRPPLK
jgi:pilus assembly protein CpaB